MRKLIPLFIAVLIVAGCATGYQPKSFTGGYSDVKLQDNIYRVNFRGNGYAGRERTADFALLRSAELTLLNGYKYFIVLESNTDIKTASFTTPVTAQTYGNSTGTINAYSTGYGSAMGTYNGHYSGTTYYSGGQTFLIHKPSTSLTIQCFKEKPTNVTVMIYDAEQINTNIKNAYNIK